MTGAKNILFLAFAFLIGLAFTTTQKTSSGKKRTVKIICEMAGQKNGQELHLYRFNGMGFTTLQTAKSDENGKFAFTVPKPKSPQFYYVGIDAQNKKSIIVDGMEPVVNLKGSMANIRKSVVVESIINRNYESVIREIGQIKQQNNQVSRAYIKVAKVPEKREAAIKQMADLDAKKLHYLDSIKQLDPYLGKIVGMNTYLSFQNNKSNYPNEIVYFANEYFKHIDLSDPSLGEIPYLYESFRNYSETLIKVGLTKKSQTEFLEKFLSFIPEDSQAYRYALGGIVSSLMQKNHPLFVEFGNRYLEKYNDADKSSIAMLSRQLDAAKSFLIGAEAPKFTQKTPDGEPLSLETLRGKVLLIDFWASWCGPCRRENPNVVLLYNKYKEKGFEILGVSLDRQKDAWVKAIEKDKLTWHHVSDLKGWQNEVAQAYSVRSIPATVLLDKEGRILDRNLRGEKLAERLKEIFGE